MNKKLAETIALAVTLLIGVVYLYHAVTMGNTTINKGLPPGYYPTLIGGLWVILNLPALILSARQIRSCRDKLIIHQGGLFLLTVLAIILYLLIWHFLGLFYLATFLLLFFLMAVYAPGEERKNLKRILVKAALALVVTGIIYLMFGRMLHVRF